MLRNNLRLAQYANPSILQRHQHRFLGAPYASYLKRGTAKNINFKTNKLTSSRRKFIYTMEELRNRSLFDELRPLTPKLRWLEFRRRIILGQFAM